MKYALVAVAALLVATAPAAAGPLLDDGSHCTTGALSVHAAHEWGHDVASFAVGDSPRQPGSLWGDKWNESQPGYRRIALGGLVGQIVFAAIQANFDEPEPRCAVEMNTAGATAYGLRMTIWPEQGGDYDPFSTGTRNRIALTSVVSGLIFQEFAAVNPLRRSMFFEGPPAPRVPELPVEEPTGPMQVRFGGAPEHSVEPKCVQYVSLRRDGRGSLCSADRDLSDRDVMGASPR
jgi:hypothetical protein